MEEIKMHRVMNENPRHGNKGAAFGLIMIIIGFIIIANQFDIFPYRIREILFSWQAISCFPLCNTLKIFIDYFAEFSLVIVHI